MRGQGTGGVEGEGMKDMGMADHMERNIFKWPEFDTKKAWKVFS